MINNDFEPYHPDNIPLQEALYGKNLISLGGLTAIDNMFSDIDLRHLKALDLGFGLGGVAFYLAEKHQMYIAGVELHPWMVQHATAHMPTTLSKALEFSTYTSTGELPYKPKTFDLVYSKGVLNHVAEKNPLFKQLNNILKPHGLLVIADWIFPKKMVDSSISLVCETKESYEQVLAETGFGQISFRDDSFLFLGYAQELLRNLMNHQAPILHQYGSELFLIIQKQHEELIEKIKGQRQKAVRIIAKKL